MSSWLRARSRPATWLFSKRSPLFVQVCIDMRSHDRLGDGPRISDLSGYPVYQAARRLVSVMPTTQQLGGRICNGSDCLNVDRFFRRIKSPRYHHMYGRELSDGFRILNYPDC
jgi:hypothetical protein